MKETLQTMAETALASGHSFRIERNITILNRIYSVKVWTCQIGGIGVSVIPLDHLKSTKKERKNGKTNTKKTSNVK